jgi:hypothetical protein
VEISAPGRAVPDDFLGLSVEWNNVRAYLGDGAGGARAATLTLLAAFEAEGHRLNLRIGGNSQDEAWWNPAGAPRPEGVTIDLGPLDIATLASVQAALGNRLVLGLNLALEDAENAAALVEAARAAIGPGGIAAFELGNEPDSFVGQGHRPAGYDWTAYLEDFHQLLSGLEGRVATPIPLQWPSLASVRWLPQLAPGMVAEREHIGVVSTHIYPFSVCDNLPPPAPENLLIDRATAEIGARYAPIAQAAHASGLLYRMGELNSVSCSGAARVSDTFASALWAADVAMQLAAVEADGVNFHGGAPPGENSHYAAFVFEAAGKPIVRPLYYGLRLVSLATAARGRLLPVTVGDPQVHAFATLGEDGAARVLVLNRGDARDVLLTAAGPTAATLVRLHAASLAATSGLTLGGQTWDGTTDGSPVGALAPETVAREGDGWLVSLPAHDAVVVTLAP